MKEINLPKILVSLPYPWRMTHSMLRRDKVASLSDKPAEIQMALDVLSRCLQSVSELEKAPVDPIPDSLAQYWGFTVDWLAEKMPTLDEFKLVTVEEALKEHGFKTPTRNMVEALAVNWLHWVVSDIATGAMNWLSSVLAEKKDLVWTNQFISIVSHYWQLVDPVLAISLLSSVASIGQVNALPLLESVEQSPLAESSVKEAAQGYLGWILGLMNLDD